MKIVFSFKIFAIICSFIVNLSLCIQVILCISVSTLIHLIKSNDPETQRLALQTIELLAIENADIVISQVARS